MDKTPQKASLKIPYLKFIESALENLKKDHTNLKTDTLTVKFMKIRSEGDSECYEIPDYIEVEIEL